MENKAAAKALAAITRALACPFVTEREARLFNAAREDIIAGDYADAGGWLAKLGYHGIANEVGAILDELVA